MTEHHVRERFLLPDVWPPESVSGVWTKFCCASASNEGG